MKFLRAIRIAPDGTPHSAAVCLCPTKGTPGLNELTIRFRNIKSNKRTLVMILEHNNVKDNFIYFLFYLSNQMSKSHTAIIFMECIIIK